MIRQVAFMITVMLSGAQVLAQQRCENDASRPSVPSERFQDGGDGTVTDRQSKLMWTRCSSGQVLTDAACSGKPRAVSWSNAQAFASEVNASGVLFFKDWRVPQVHELAALTDLQCNNPRINLSVFPNTPAASYWTSSTRKPPDSPGRAYALSFGAAGVALADKEESALVRLVRSAR
jgi:hypothetical protein